METGYKFRLYLLTTLLLVGFGVLLTRLHEFQIERRTEFLNQVPGNRTVTVREPGIRGEITDRNGIVLARNHRQYEVAFNLEEIRQAYISQHVEEPVAKRVKMEDGMYRKASEKDIVGIVNEWTIAALKDPKIDLARNYNASALRTHYITHRDLIPFSYRSDLNYNEFARFAEHNLQLPGVYLNLRPLREYPYGTLASHILGYLNQWENGDIPESEARKFDHYIGDAKGISGIEAAMNKVLRGPEGTRTIIKDEKNRTVRMSDYTKPGVGATVRLTIDARKQYLLENTLRRTGRAAGVIMDVNTGEILAMASVPDFDPNAFIPSISADQWKEYTGNQRLSPFTNRAITAFTPGSTLKIATAISGAFAGIASRSFSCDGFVSYGSYQPACWLYNKSRGRHGSLTLPMAIQKSCNPFFFKMANTVRAEGLVESFTKIGFGTRTGIELPKEDPGILPGNRAWRSRNPKAKMTPADVAQTAIGQGQSMATPLQLCAMAACVANGGKYYQPRVVKSAVAENGGFVIKDKPVLKIDLIEAGIKPADFELIRKGMYMSVNEAGGTSGRVRMENIAVAAKTGTAQTNDDGKESNNSLMISFAPFEKPRYAVCVVVQNAGSGGAVCGPLVHLIYRGLFAQEEDMQLPLKPQTEFKGNTDRIEEIKMPEDALAAIEATATPAGEDGETGDEAGAVGTVVPAARDVTEPVIPTLAPEADAEGTVVPRAVPVR
ncbi:MAG: penicillin-binding transpeptidase domain-containing protein [Verrucomicrobiota bacterium]